MIRQIKKEVYIVAGNHEYKETDMYEFRTVVFITDTHSFVQTNAYYGWLSQCLQDHGFNLYCKTTSCVLSMKTTFFVLSMKTTSFFSINENDIFCPIYENDKQGFV